MNNYLTKHTVSFALLAIFILLAASSIPLFDWLKLKMDLESEVNAENEISRTEKYEWNSIWKTKIKKLKYVRLNRLEDRTNMVDGIKQSGSSTGLKT